MSFTTNYLLLNSLTSQSKCWKITLSSLPPTCSSRNNRKPWFILFFIIYHSVQSLSHVQLFATSWTVALQASLSITNFRSLLKVMSIKSVMPSNHFIFCRPLLLLPSIFPSISIRVFSNESVLPIRWPKYWSFSFSISPSNEHPGLISFRMDCLDLLTVQEILKSLLQNHSSKASILWCSAFFLLLLGDIWSIFKIKVQKIWNTHKMLIYVMRECKYARNNLLTNLWKHSEKEKIFQSIYDDTDICIYIQIHYKY